MNLAQLYRNYTTALNQTLMQLPWARLDQMVKRIHQARMLGQQVFILGNGGSAATASHLACDLAKNINQTYYPRLRVLSLTDNMALFSASANDLGYENVFVEQLANFIREGDLVIAISASGNSRNVLRAVTFAQANGATVIGWSGYDGGKLAALADLSLVIRNHCIEQVEDIHLILAHIITAALRGTMEEGITDNSTGQMQNPVKSQSYYDLLPQPTFMNATVGGLANASLNAAMR